MDWQGPRKIDVHICINQQAVSFANIISLVNETCIETCLFVLLCLQMHDVIDLPLQNSFAA